MVGSMSVAVRKDINDLVALGRGLGVNNRVWRSTWTSKDWTTGCCSLFQFWCNHL